MGWISALKDYIRGSEGRETLQQPDFGGGRKYMQPYSLTSPGKRLLDGGKDGSEPYKGNRRF